MIWVGGMAYAFPGDGALDYSPCRYGGSRLLFRGPPRGLDRPYVAVLGGTETYGKFVEAPYPTLVERLTGQRMVNLGCMNAGPDAYLSDPAVLEVASQARLVVLQVLGAQNVSNDFYIVHPRRNDRFLRAQPALRALYPEVDFTEFHFTRHMLRTLLVTDPDRFMTIAEALRRAWVGRMCELVRRVQVPVLLLWLGPKPPPRPGTRINPLQDPALVDSRMVAAVRDVGFDYLEIVASREARAFGVDGMAFGPMEKQAAQELPGPAVHAEVASALASRLLALA